MTTESRPILAWLAAVAVGLAVALAGTGPASAQAVATSVRLGEHPDHTRFVLELTEGVEYRLFTLADPYRLVLELPEIDWRLAEKGKLKGAGLVKSYRYGDFGRKRSRVVLDLFAPAKVGAHFLLPPEDGKPARLVLDIVPDTEKQFLASAGWPENAAPERVPPENPAEEAKPVDNADGRFIIALDAGHGGVDPGAVGAGGTYEKDVVLETVLALKAELEKREGYIVVLTRGDDAFLTLKDRVRSGRAGKADLFISLHADSIADASVHGASVYTLSETASDSEAAELAKSENAADVISGVDLSGENDAVTNILIDLTQRETNNRSATFAQMLLPELDRQTGLLSKPHRFAGFRVLKAPDVPSVLIELGFLSNATDEERLSSAKFRKGMARSIAKAVDTYYERMSAVAQNH